MRYIIVYSMYHSCVAVGRAGALGGGGGRAAGWGDGRVGLVASHGYG